MFVGHSVMTVYRPAQHPQLFTVAVQVATQGVAIFFLISGFLLYRPFLVARRSGERLPLSGYLRRRVARIVPGYWVALTLVIATGLASGVNVHNWWVFYAFGQVYSLQTIGQGMGVAWTLCVEVSFYLALPLLAAAAAGLGGGRARIRGDVVLLAGLAAGSLLYRAHFSNPLLDMPKTSTLPGYFSWFALGMALALLSVETQRGRAERVVLLVTRRPGVCWAGAIAGSVLQYELMRAHGRMAPLLSHFNYALVALLVLAPGVFGERAGGMPRAVLRNRALTWVGVVSYGLYLYHYTVLQEIERVYRHLGLAVHYWMVPTVCLPASLALAAGSYHLLEAPAMRMARASRIQRPAPTLEPAVEGALASDSSS